MIEYHTALRNDESDLHLATQITLKHNVNGWGGSKEYYVQQGYL